MTFTAKGTPTVDMRIEVSNADNEGNFDVEIVLGDSKESYKDPNNNIIKETYKGVCLREGLGEKKAADHITKNSKLVSVFEAPAEETVGSLKLRTEARDIHVIKGKLLENLRAASLLAKRQQQPPPETKTEPLDKDAAQAAAGQPKEPKNPKSQSAGGVGNAEPPKVSSEALVGNEADRSGLRGLMQVKDMRWVSFADLWALRQANRIADSTVDFVLQQMIGFCNAREDCIAVIDPPPNLRPLEMRKWREGFQVDADRAVMYYPYVHTVDPATNAKIAVPPSGYVTGLFSRVDRERGVWKAPANELLFGAVGLEFEATEREHGLLNELSVNVIKSDNGIRVMGARTLTVTNKQYKYLPVRRLSDFIMTSAIDSMKWTLFEPNTTDLWAQVKRELNNFLHGLWRRGALFGDSPAEAFEVICDRTNNSDVDIENGEMYVSLKIWAVKPAEFIVISLSHRTVEATTSA